MNEQNNNNSNSHSGEIGPSQGNNSHSPPSHYQPTGYHDEPEDEIDLIELAKHFWQDRQIIAKITGAFVIVGIIIALFSAVEYKADAVLMPEMQSSQSRAQSLLNRFGGFLGISGTQSVGTITPKIYPKIVQSVPYNLQLMNVPVTFSKYDTTVTTAYYFQHLYSPSLLSYVKRYTIGLPGVILGLFSGNQAATKQHQQQLNLQTMKRDTVFNLTNKQQHIVGALKNRINIQLDKKSGLVTLSATMPDPMAAAELTKASIRLLTQYVKEYRTRKAAKNLHFMQEQVKEAKQDFNEAQQQLAEFRDNNLSLASAQSKSQLKNLRSAYNLTFNIYNSLRQQLQQAKLTLQMQTPVVSILQPVTVPQSKSKPNRKLIVIVFLILGIIVALGWSLIRDFGQQIIQEIQNDGKDEPDQEAVSVQTKVED